MSHADVSPAQQISTPKFRQCTTCRGWKEASEANFYREGPRWSACCRECRNTSKRHKHARRAGRGGFGDSMGIRGTGSTLSALRSHSMMRDPGGRKENELTNSLDRIARRFQQLPVAKKAAAISTFLIRFIGGKP